MQMNKLGKTLEDFTSVLFERTMDVSNGASSLSESFLAAGQYIVHAEDGDETLGISGDSMDSGGKDRVPLREQVTEGYGKATFQAFLFEDSASARIN
ncbi:hypothetical protein CDAR_31944 [Caerostris darwini]|uniref:Uncharacterized protein n=1 Tax=Caerostris darwini TaxID=1538125 RepID=A0AAV4RU90_9ARAC|nr:hypothetical protein CDAR_31944 [Caerostris darwini]